ncbi:MAG: SDR family oxidoreductase, partial [Xanthomonadales bacterium]|nr:SDR family oxidoreductase [Xanthomonadales bacterium]
MSRWLGFEGKTVFVMGGTSGINLGIAEAFAEQGADLVVASRSQDKVDAAVEKLASYGHKACGFAADARDIEAIENGLKSVSDQFERINVMIVGQAGNFPAAALAMSANAFKSVVDIDLLGTFNTVKAAHQYLAPKEACIIAISAPQAVVPMPMQAHVCAAKAGVDMLTKVLAMELGHQGIRCNGIIPGPIEDTEGMARLAPSEEAREACRRTVPMERLGTKRDIANCAMFLASPLADYITGAIIPVDGGWSLGGAA